MTRALFGLCLLLLALPLVVGCTTVRYCNEGGREMVTVSNARWKLLGFITIASGDPDYPNGEVCTWFTNTVTMATNMRLLDEEIVQRKASGFRDLNSVTANESMLLFLLSRHTLRSSAELTR